MIKYASFMITLQNGNHGSTDLMESCTIKGGNGRSPSWMEDFDGKIILKSEISMPPLIPGGSFPWIPSHFIPYYIGYTYIAHMSTYVYIYIYAPYCIPNTISHHLPAEAPGQAPPSVFPRPVPQEGTPPVWSCRCHGSVASSGRPGWQARHQKSSENWSCISIYRYTNIDIWYMCLYVYYILVGSCRHRTIFLILKSFGNGFRERPAKTSKEENIGSVSSALWLFVPPLLRNIVPGKLHPANLNMLAPIHACKSKKKKRRPHAAAGRQSDANLLEPKLQPYQPPARTLTQSCLWMLRSSTRALHFLQAASQAGLQLLPTVLQKSSCRLPILRDLPWVKSAHLCAFFWCMQWWSIVTKKKDRKVKSYYSKLHRNDVHEPCWHQLAVQSRSTGRYHKQKHISTRNKLSWSLEWRRDCASQSTRARKLWIWPCGGD